MAIVGGAIMPVIQGALADRIGLHHAFLVPVICYLYIVFYGLAGSKPNSERAAAGVAVLHGGATDRRSCPDRLAWPAS
jgi:MFS transporter, FHS family, L-fucose permease